MNKAILFNIIILLYVFIAVIFNIPTIWVVIAPIVIMIAVIFNPFKISAYGVPKGFTEKQFNTGEVTLNYVEGSNNGPPILFIPGQAESWHGYKQVMPSFSKNYHVFVVDVRGHGKSSRTSGQYSYNICGKDLKVFLEKIVKKPTIVSGLSSGGVLAVWLAANTPKLVSKIICEDPPLFSSMWPRIKKERFMYRSFKIMVETLGKAKRDIRGYFAKQAIPHPKKKKELLYIPSFMVNYIIWSLELNTKLRPFKKFDLFNARFDERVGLKDISDYDVDFSRATIDGRLSKGFNPKSALKKIMCPVLLIHGNWSRHEYWGLLGALDNKDIEDIRSIIKDFTYVQIKARHNIHSLKPKEFIKVVSDYLT